MEVAPQPLPAVLWPLLALFGHRRSWGSPWGAPPPATTVVQDEMVQFLGGFPANQPGMELSGMTLCVHPTR